MLVVPAPVSGPSDLVDWGRVGHQSVDQGWDGEPRVGERIAGER